MLALKMMVINGYKFLLNILALFYFFFDGEGINKSINQHNKHICLLEFGTKNQS